MKLVLSIMSVLLLYGCELDTKPNYQLGVDANGQAWVLNTKTGDLKKCWQGTVGLVAPSCYVAVDRESKNN